MHARFADVLPREDHSPERPQVARPCGVGGLLGKNKNIMQTQILLTTPPPSWYHYVVKRIMSVDFRVLDTLPSPKAPVQKAQEAYNRSWGILSRPST